MAATLTLTELRNCPTLPKNARIVITGDKIESPKLIRDLIMFVDAHTYTTTSMSKELRTPFLDAVGIKYISNDSIMLSDALVLDQHSLREFEERYRLGGMHLRVLQTQQILPDKFSKFATGWISPIGEIRGEFTTETSASDVFYDLNSIAVRFGNNLNIRCQVFGFEAEPVVEFRIESSGVVTTHRPTDTLKLRPLKTAGWFTAAEQISYHVGEKKLREFLLL